MTLPDGQQPHEPPDGTIWQRCQPREWLLTVRGFSPATVEYLHNQYPVAHIEVLDLGLEDVFKDYIRGRRACA